jgi:choline dehydrogenase
VTLRWDYVIVGGGSGGATLAARLSEDPTRRILLLEAGGGAWSPLIHIPGFLGNVMYNDTLNWNYQGDPDASLAGRALVWMAGRVLGGSSSINGMVYGRGLPDDYTRWESAGNPGWSWDDMLPYFRRMESWSGAPDPSRGTSGPLKVRPFEETHAVCLSVMNAYVDSGLPFVPDYAAGVSEGIGITQATQNGGWRNSADAAYLRPARARKNLSVLTHAHVHKLEIERGRCVGVTFTRNGRLQTVRAEREVAVCAGAIGSPKLLMLSGIGDPDAMKVHGITTVNPLPGVGQNLNEHVNAKLSASVNVPTYNTERFGMRKLANGLRFLFDRAGPAASPANHVQGFVKSDSGLVSADYQVQVMALGFNADFADHTNGVSVVVSPCHTEARGSISLRSADPRDPPHIAMEMLGNANDVALLTKACRHAREMLEAGPCRDFGGKLFLPAPGTDSDADWLQFFRETAGVNWHPTSTCRMGPGPGDVVDATLAVHGLMGLSIADASVMPSVTSGNTNAPTIAIAERAADFISARTA